MDMRIAGAALTLLVMTGCPAFAQSKPAPGPIPQSLPKPSLVPADFDVPTAAETADFKLVPLGPALVKVDFAAYMSSIDHLQKTFTRSTDWPHAGISDADAMRDMETEQARFRNRESFAYAVLTPDGLRERGSVYVSPSPVRGYDAVVRLWVTKADYDAGFDATLYAWVRNWIATDWPFAKVAYPGRSVDWKTWDSLVAANGTKQATP